MRRGSVPLWFEVK